MSSCASRDLVMIIAWDQCDCCQAGQGEDGGVHRDRMAQQHGYPSMCNCANPPCCPTLLELIHCISVNE